MQNTQTQQTRRNRQGGFTLIELMIVVAIIGVLASIAVPQYQTYIARSQFAEAMTLASGAKTSAAERYVTTGGWPADNPAAGLPAATDISGEYVLSVGVVSNAVTVTFKPATANVSAPLATKTVTFTGTASGNGSITWACTSTVANQYTPGNCTGA